MTETLTGEPLSIGALAQRAGVATSALRFYEAEGLIASARTPAGQRRFARSVLRRVAFIGAAQAVGLDLKQIRAALRTLPDARTPTQADWTRLSRAWQPLLDARIEALTRLRDQLASCIGCGCLSLTRCKLYNAGDTAGRHGAGPRYLIGERPPYTPEMATAPAPAPPPARSAATHRRRPA